MTAPRRQNLRADMPQTSAWIDDLRAAFGVEGINDAIRSGMAGGDAFFAKENGFEIGSRCRYQNGVSAAQMELVVPKVAVPDAGGRRAVPGRGK